MSWNERQYSTPYGGGPKPRAIHGLLIAILVMFVIEVLLLRTFPGVVFSLMLNPEEVIGSLKIWQLITYGFLHSNANLGHIFFNMFGLWMFGRDIERLMGPQRFLTYYMTCVIGAGIVQLIFAEFQGANYPTIGASGGLFGILLAYGLTFPNRTVMLLIPPIPMKAKYFVIVYGLLELFLGVSGLAPSIAHFAHLGGMLFGYVLLRHWARPRRS